MFLLLFLNVQLYTAPLEFSLNQPISLEEAQQFDQHPVSVTGFLYTHPSGYQILAHQPNLKSCCIGSKSLAYQQLLVIPPLPESLAAVKIQGIFSLNSQKNAENFPYLIRNAEIKQSSPQTQMLIWIVFIIGILLLIKIIKMILKRVS